MTSHMQKYYFLALFLFKESSTFFLQMPKLLQHLTVEKKIYWVTLEKLESSAPWKFKCCFWFISMRRGKKSLNYALLNFLTWPSLNRLKFGTQAVLQAGLYVAFTQTVYRLSVIFEQKHYFYSSVSVAAAGQRRPKTLKSPLLDWFSLNSSRVWCWSKPQPVVFTIITHYVHAVITVSLQKLYVFQHRTEDEPNKITLMSVSSRPQLGLDFTLMSFIEQSNIRFLPFSISKQRLRMITV